jgi:hypothetical protein
MQRDCRVSLRTTHCRTADQPRGTIGHIISGTLARTGPRRQRRRPANVTCCRRAAAEEWQGRDLVSWRSRPKRGCLTTAVPRTGACRSSDCALAPAGAAGLQPTTCQGWTLAHASKAACTSCWHRCQRRTAAYGSALRGLEHRRSSRVFRVARDSFRDNREDSRQALSRDLVYT